MQSVYSAQTVKLLLRTNVFLGMENCIVETISSGVLGPNVRVVHRESPRTIWSEERGTKYSILNVSHV